MTGAEKTEWREVKTMINRLDEHVRIKLPAMEEDIDDLRSEVKGIVGTMIKGIVALVVSIITGFAGLFWTKGS